MKYALLYVFFSLLFSVGGCMSPSILSTHEQQLGDSYNNSGNYDEALIHYNKYLEVSKTLGSLRNLQSEAGVCRKIAYLHSLKGRYSESLSYLIKSSKLDSLDNNQMELIEDYRDIGKLYSFIGNYLIAIKYLNSALALNKGMEDAIKNLKVQSIADTYLALSKTNLSIGNFNESLQNILKSIELFNKTKDKKGISEAYLQYAYLLIESDEAEKAFKIIEHSKILAKDIGVDTTMHFFLESEAMIRIGQYEKALAIKQKLFGIAEKKNIMPQMIWFCISIGDLYHIIGNEDKANNYYSGAYKYSKEIDKSIIEQSLNYRFGSYTEAETGFKNFGSISGLAVTLLRMGEAQLGLNEPDSAKLLFLKAASTFKKMNYNDGLSRSFAYLGKIMLDNDAGLAKKYIDSALAITNNPDNLWQIYYLNGIYHHQINQIDSAILNFKKSIEIIEDIRSSFSVAELKSNYFNDKTIVYENLINDLFLQDKPEEALYYAERSKSRSFLDLLVNKKLNYHNSKDSLLIKKEQDYRKKIQLLLKNLSNDDFENDTLRKRSINQVSTKELTDAQKEYDNILINLELQNPEYKQLVAVSSPKVKKIQEHLTDSSCVIEYFISQKKIFAWIIRKNSLTVKCFPIDLADLKYSISDFNRIIENIEITDFAKKKALYHLYNMVFKNIEPELNGIITICILPHRSAHFIPFHALSDSAGRYLIEKYNIYYAPSYSVLLLSLMKKNQTQNNLLGMALGNYHIGDLDTLPATKDEINNIEPFFSSNLILVEEKATETAFKKEAPGFNIIHLATHGVFDSQLPMHSYILFPGSNEDDGRLTVSEIFDLNLNCSLVTLSACQTGLGNIDTGDELVGLSRAFMNAGAPVIIVSLWSVSDQATSIIMSNFYKYFTAGYSAVESLNYAQKDLMYYGKNAKDNVITDKKNIKYTTTKKIVAPYFWAPFIIIGNGNLRIN